MMTTRRVQWTWLILLLGLTACGASAGGGPSGTGISAVTGNVAEVTGASNDVVGITVRIAGTTLATITDANGAFTLEGDFGGDVTVVFERADDGLRAETDLVIPEGGMVTLRDIAIDAPSEEVTPDRRDIVLEGKIESVDCASGALLIASRFDRNGTSLTVRLDSAFLHDPAGDAVECDALRPGDRVDVTGQIDNDGAIINADVEAIVPKPTSTPRSEPTANPTPRRPEPTPRATETRPVSSATRNRPVPTATDDRSDPRPPVRPEPTRVAPVPTPDRPVPAVTPADGRPLAPLPSTTALVDGDRVP